MTNPPLRFKQDNGSAFPDWIQIKLSNIAEINKGAQLSKEKMQAHGDFPVLNGGIHFSGYANNYNCSANTITISEGGNSCGFVNFIDVLFWSGGHCYTLKIKLKNITIFIFQFLKYKEKSIQKLRVGSGLPNIQKKDLSKFNIYKPNIQEQQKIADFLMVVDDIIKLREQIVELKKKYKKSLLQRMFV